MRREKYTVWIASKGESMEMYDVEDDDEGNEVLCWIESKIGQKFEIFVKSHEKKKDAWCKISIDGVYATDLPLEYQEQDSVEGLSVDCTTIRPFVFARLPTTDDEERALRDPSQNSYGEIMVEISVGKLKWKKLPKHPEKRKKLDEQAKQIHKLKSDPVHESNVKAGLQKIGLADEEKTVVDEEWSWRLKQTEAEKKKCPIKFRFRYRDREFLERHEIIPSNSRSCATPPPPNAGTSKKSKKRKRQAQEQPAEQRPAVQVKREPEEGTGPVSREAAAPVKVEVDGEEIRELRRQQLELNARIDAILNRTQVRVKVEEDGNIGQSSSAPSAPMELVVLDDGTIDLTAD